MPATVLILTGLLIIGYLGVRAATWLRIPHGVFLVLIGIVSGLVLRHEAAAWSGALTQAFPQIVLYILLPPLIFEAAFHLDYDHFKRDLAPIAALSVAALALSTFFIGYGLHWIFALPLLPCLTFGALISATDPVAVVALFREVGAPARLSTLIEGESLLNDGTAMVLFRILLAATMLQSQASPLLLSTGILRFLAVALGSTLTGLLMAGLMSFLLRLVSLSASAQLGITLASAYLSFIVSDAFLNLSGVITTVIVGISLGRRARIELNRDAFKSVDQIWEFLALSANTIVFMAVGLTVDLSWLVGSFAFIPATLVITSAARAVSVFSVIPLVNALSARLPPALVTHLGLSRPIGIAYQTVLMWGGLRGALALGLVLTLPAGFPHRELFVALAASVVLTTLILNALTTRKVLGLLRLDQMTAPELKTLDMTVGLIGRETESMLGQMGRDGTLAPRLADEHARKFLQALRPGPEPENGGEPGRDSNEAELRFALLSLLASEKAQYESRLDDGTLSKPAYLRLTGSVAERIRIVESSSPEKLESYPLIQGIRLPWFSELFFRALPHRSADRLLPTLVTHFESLLNLRLALEAGRKELTHPRLARLYDEWLGSVTRATAQFFALYSHYSGTVQALAISGATSAASRRTLERLRDASIIGPSVFVRLNARIRESRLSARSEAILLLRPSAAYRVMRIPLFQSLPKVEVRKIAESSPVRVFSPGKSVVCAGENEPSLFVLVAGVLEIRESDRSGRRLLPGDYFGIRALMLGEPHPWTVLAEVTSEVMVIRRSVLDILLHEHPSFFSNTEDRMLSDSVTF